VGVSQNFIECDRDQGFLLPPDVRDWLPAGHLAWFVIDTVGQLDLSAIYGDYRADGHGRPAHDPAMMVALLLYAYAVGERSSRRIERRCVEDVAFRVIAANQTPDHATIARFRARHDRRLAALFGGVLGLCRRAGLVSIGTVALDGTKLAANAALGANREYAAIAAEILADAARVDAAEDELYGPARGDELPPELADPSSRRERLARAKAELEAEHAARQAEWDAKEARYREHIEQTGRRPKGRAPSKPPQPEALFASKRNLTDLDSRIVRDKGALIQGYNAQAVVAEGQVIIAAQIINSAADGGQLQPMVTAARDHLTALGITDTATTVLADNGYWNSGQIAALHEQGITAIVAPSTERRRRATPRRRASKQGAQAERINAILATDDGHALYARRKQIVEPVFGHIKHLRGITRLARRGLAACNAEWQLIAATHNLLKLYRAAPTPA
jgi:transposase